MAGKKKFESEAAMQSVFSSWLRGGEGLDWLRAAGLNSAGFELKHVRCRGRKRCTSDRCFSRLAIGDHETAQWRALERAHDAQGLVHKISDSGIGYKPFDCFVLALAGAFFVVGFSCPMARAVRVYAITSVLWGLEVEGQASVTEGEMMALGRALDLAGR